MKLCQFLRGVRSPLRAQLQLNLSAMVLARHVCTAISDVYGVPAPDFRTLDVGRRARLIEDAAALIERHAVLLSPSASASTRCADPDDTAVLPRAVETSGR